MRVHPSILGPKRRSLYWVLLLLLLNFVFIGLAFSRGAFDIVNDRGQGMTEEMVRVLVLDEPMRTGDFFESVRVSIRARPSSVLPSARITSRDSIVGKVASGPLPAGIILSEHFLADALPQLPVSYSGQKQSTDEFLQQIANYTAGIDLTFQGTVPVRGARVALSLAVEQSKVLVAEAWIEQVDMQNARVRVKPEAISELTSLRNQKFVAIELPQTGVNPFLEQRS